MDLLHTERPEILVLAITASGRQRLQSVLKDRYAITMTRSREQLQQALAAPAFLPALILLDSKMSMGERAEVFEQLRGAPQTRNIPVVLFGNPESTEEELHGFQQGATDFIVTPLSSDIFRAKIQARIAQVESHNTTRLINRKLEAVVAQMVTDMGTVQDATLMAMTALAKTRDTETGNHICRTQHYVRALCLALRRNPHFAHYMSDQTIESMFKAAPLHDIGKVGIPDSILLKPGRLDPHEMTTMKTHTTMGMEAIEYAKSKLTANQDYLSLAGQIAHSHHEQWDGSGYPQGLAGNDIPVGARVMRVADVYDAITSRRVYKSAMSHATAVAILTEGRGQQFDPAIVDAFLSIEDEFKEIATKNADADQLQAQVKDPFSTSSHDKIRLLIVEDKDESRKLLRIALTGMEFEVRDASSGAEALEMAAQLRPDVILLNIQLPGELNGFEVCEKTKSGGGSRSTYVILMSDLGAQENFDEAMRVGADAYVVKPFRLASIKQLIRNRSHSKDSFTLIRSLETQSEQHVPAQRA